MLLILFNTQPLELFLKLFPVKRFEAEDDSVNVERGNDPLSVVGLFNEPRGFDGFFDVNFVVENPFIIEELFCLLAVGAPTRRVDRDFGHIGPP
jgi:hypothetical protein